jgi:hypothetical protein
MRSNFLLKGIDASRIAMKQTKRTGRRITDEITPIPILTKREDEHERSYTL